MALSHHGKVAVIPLAAVVVLLFAGAAQAWNCQPNEKDCNGCINPMTDVNNCGRCGNKCPACGNGVPTCTNAKCGFTCKPGYKNCDNKWENGCETDVSKDILNCGGCGNCCVAPPKADAKCSNGKCEYVCMAGYANCDKDWKNGCECKPDSDVEHCGGCGKKCPRPQYYGGEAKCTRGKCEPKSCKRGMKYDEGKKCCSKDGKYGDDDEEGKKGGKGGKYGDDDDEGKKGGKGGKYGDDDDEGKKGGKGGKYGDDDDEGKKGGKGGKGGDDNEGKKGGKGGEHDGGYKSGH